MPIRLRALSACVLMGVVTTIAVAWTLAFIRPRNTPSPGLFAVDRAAGIWMGVGEEGPGWRRITILGAPGVTDAGLSQAAMLPRWLDTTVDGPIESRAITAIGAGWPLICVVARRIGVGHDQPPPGSNAWRSGLGPQWVEWGAWQGALTKGDTSKAGSSDDRLLPIGVHPMGFTFNAALFTMLWSMPFAARSLRIALRRRRGLCERCAYSLAALPEARCPECGQARR